MNKEAIYDIWAPERVKWSPWVKPVLFSWMEECPDLPSTPPFSCNLDWVEELPSRSALILDLPGSEGVLLGLMLAGCGYRPVPLYNSVPWRSRVRPETNEVFHAVVDTWPIVAAIKEGAETSAGANLRSDAPPAFLLDANRRGPTYLGMHAEYDNRSISFTTDFPSANFLQANGIQSVVLVQRLGEQPQADLSHTLRRWQEEGLAIYVKQLELAEPIKRIEVTKPSQFGGLWYRALALLGLRKHPLGGYGGLLSDGSAG
jgi:hypothetical protein